VSREARPNIRRFSQGVGWTLKALSKAKFGARLEVEDVQPPLAEQRLRQGGFGRGPHQLRTSSHWQRL